MTLVLDVMVHIPKGEKKTVSFVLSAGENEGDALTHAQNISDDMQVLRVMDLAWTHSQVEMRYLGVKTYAGKCIPDDCVAYDHAYAG